MKLSLEAQAFEQAKLQQALLRSALMDAQRFLSMNPWEYHRWKCAQMDLDLAKKWATLAKR